MATPANITRRRALTTFAAIPAMGTAAIVPAMAEPVDPLIDAIEAYRAAMADFNANAPMDNDKVADAYAEISYLPAMKVLEAWDRPATTFAGAREAIRFAHSETTMFEASPMVQPLLLAALAYLDSEVAS